MAGAVGIEPTQMVLETIVLPLYEAPTVFTASYYIKPREIAGLITSFLYEKSVCGNVCNTSESPNALGCSSYSLWYCN